MLLVAILDVLQNLQGLLRRGGFYDHLLETAVEGTIPFDGVAELVERCGTDALYGAACQCRLHDVGGIHAARR